jgi:hypothetical protein
MRTLRRTHRTLTDKDEDAEEDAGHNNVHDIEDVSAVHVEDKDDL